VRDAILVADDVDPLPEAWSRQLAVDLGERPVRELFERLGRSRRGARD
jgi:hypothetical protein